MERRENGRIPESATANRPVVTPRGFRRGVALVWVAIFGMVLIGLVGLSLDWGKVAFNVNQLQNAADAGALAGAQAVRTKPPEVTRQETHDWAFANTAERLEVTLRTTPQPDPFTDNDDLDIILGRWISIRRQFYPTLDTPDAVKVIARRAAGLEEEDAPPLGLVFGPAFGTNTANARCEAIGWNNAVSGAGLIVLDKDPNDKSGKAIPGLYIASNVGEIRVVGGTIHVNTVWEGVNSEAAVYVPSGGQMACARLTVTGHTDPAPGSTDWERIWTDDNDVATPYDISEGAPYLPDPLRNLQPPPIPTDVNDDYIVASNEKITTSCTLNPGYYPRGISVTTAGVFIKLNSGTYWIGGGNASGNQIDGLIMTGGTLEAHGVLIYLTKDYVNTGGKWAQLDIGGNVVTDITPPGDEVTPKIKDGLPGISIWQDRANHNTASLHGEGGMWISGTLYFPKNHVYLAGNPGKAGNQILCGSLEVFGRAEILVIYDGRNGLFKSESVLVK